MQIKILTTVYAPSALGNDPAFEGDVLNVDDEAGAELIASGQAVAEGAVAASEVNATQPAQDHADSLGVDLSQVEGTGAAGQIVKSDVTEAFKAANPEVEEN